MTDSISDRVIVIDLETTANGGPKGDNPSPKWPNNKVLAYGGYAPSTKLTGTAQYLMTTADSIVFAQLLNAAIEAIDDPIIVMHNSGFDLAYLYREGVISPHAMSRIKLHDTAFFEYKTSGHKFKYPSLNDTCMRRGVSLRKTLDLGAYLAGGGKMEDIPYSQLVLYLTNDLYMTFDLCMIQSASPRFGDLVQEHLKVFAEMLVHGLFLDVPLTRAVAKKSIEKEKELKSELTKSLKKRIRIEGTTKKGGVSVTPPFEEKKFNLYSNKGLSSIFCGSPSLHRIYASVKYIIDAPILPDDIIEEVWPEGPLANGYYSFKADKLDLLAKALDARGRASRVEQIDLLLQYREVNKVLNTFLLPFLALAKLSEDESTVRPDINTTSTNTGRTSSSDPNGQNMPPTVKSLFTVRHPDKGGKLIDIDVKQLEVVAAASLSGDTQLISDLLDGVDVHYNVGKGPMGWGAPSTVSKEERRVVKSIVFGMLYGGGAGTLSVGTGLTKAQTKEIIDEFYRIYPGVGEWHDRMLVDIDHHKTPAGFKNGEQVYESWISMYDQMYHFEEYEVPGFVKAKTGRTYGFMPTQIKNYPVQGFGGYDIMARLLYYIDRYLKAIANTDNDYYYKPLMSVHDSFLLETNIPEYLVQTIVESACNETRSDLKLPVPLKCEMNTSDRWE